MIKIKGNIQLVHMALSSLNGILGGEMKFSKVIELLKDKTTQDLVERRYGIRISTYN